MNVFNMSGAFLECAGPLNCNRRYLSYAVASVMSTDDWLILQENYNPEQNLKYESLFTIYYRE